MKSIESILNQAIRQREKLSLVTNAMRLVNGSGDGLDGLLIDRYHKHLHVQVLSEHWQKRINEIVGVLISCLPVEYLIVKTRRGLEIKEEVFVGEEAQTTIEEHGIKFQVNLNDNLNCGLFLDMRHNRLMVRQASDQKKVLNCFSYTCSFGAYARLGGAREVINTDISRKILECGKNNYRLNDLFVSENEFIKADSLFFLQRAFKKKNTFDMIILDPPSFARHDTKVFQVKRDLPELIALAVAVLNPGGVLLVTTNYSEITYADLEQMLSSAVKCCRVEHIERRVGHVQRLGQDADFVASNSFKESYLAGLWVKFL